MKAGESYATPGPSVESPSGTGGGLLTPVRIRLSHSRGPLLPVSSPSGTVELTPWRVIGGFVLRARNLRVSALALTPHAISRVPKGTAPTPL